MKTSIYDLFERLKMELQKNRYVKRWQTRTDLIDFYKVRLWYCILPQRTCKVLEYANSVIGSEDNKKVKQMDLTQDHHE